MVRPIAAVEAATNPIVTRAAAPARAVRTLAELSAAAASLRVLSATLTIMLSSRFRRSDATLTKADDLPGEASWEAWDRR